MPRPRAFRELRLLDGSSARPATLVCSSTIRAETIRCRLTAGDSAVLGDDRLADLEAVFLTHHRVDHFIGFDRVVLLGRDRLVRVRSSATKRAVRYLCGW